jgi:hypothetical protein
MSVRTWMDAQMEADNDQKLIAEMRLLKERVSSVKRPILWNELIERVQSHVSTYRGEFPDKRLYMSLLNPSGMSFSIRKTSFPCVTLQTDFLDRRRVELVFTYRENDQVPTSTWADYIDFTIDEHDHVQFVHRTNILIDTDEAANIVLEPFMNPKFMLPEVARVLPMGSLRKRS